MNKNINTVVKLTEKELECVIGGRRIVGGEERRIEDGSSVFRKPILIGIPILIP